MTIEIREKGTKRFYQEVVNVSSQYRALIREPEMKLNDNIRTLRSYVIVCAVCLVLLTIMRIALGPDTLSNIGTFLLLLGLIFSAFLLYNLTRRVNDYLADDRTSTVTLDEDGIEVVKEGERIAGLTWAKVAFVRTFSESTCFFARTAASLVISIPARYRDEVLSYLKSSEINVTVIE